MALKDMCNDYMLEIVDEDLRGKKYENCSDEKEKCVICLSKLKGSEEASKLECGHKFHFECIKKWLIVENMCPLCKEAVLN
ncbi:putative E3 ubiquitin-protein ligase RHG1A [Cardamine amara subsp. amara]|uniref:RING-type E3 ubiquitin transferase n=1 Tax=Cardamine amara subsp. amara TaxID=228776 RepID=A0ABD1BDA7_CARAN